MKIAYKRVLLKLSGEALAGERKNGIDADTLGKISNYLHYLFLVYHASISYI